MGPSVAEDLKLIGIHSSGQLIGKNPIALYESLCLKTGARQDPCVLDVFISITRFMDGEPPRVWWDYTAQRKRMQGVASR
ncbi:helix-hairpin-helix domain-containing protein [Rhodoferax sp.]|uniref:helix-hairpin-helix domain-containing protein n=1 Tax=Rhodoferax sp. TaxID=50421 RepID=UPI00276E2006|nr:helix-hairpin-helix domain-containing protein [Rhodoferax sp.]